jgi:AraC-like DNA-binding protein
MRLVDTTAAQAHHGMQTLICTNTARRECFLAERFRVHLLGMYAAHVGPSWDSNGRKESDYLHHIELPLSGRRQVVCGGEVHELTPGTVWFLPGNTPVERRCNQACEVIFFKLSAEWLPGVDPLLDWPQRVPRKAGTFDPAAWRHLMDGTRTQGVAELLQLRGMLLSWLAIALPELDEIISRHLGTHKPFTAFFDAVEQQLGADLRISSLAIAHGSGVEAFSMAFARSTGMSPKAYVTRRLNQEALRLVINSDLKMKEIAEQLRFKDEFYFSRFFKKLNGCSPKAYRRQFFGSFHQQDHESSAAGDHD